MLPLSYVDADASAVVAAALCVLVAAAALAVAARRTAGAGAGKPIPAPFPFWSDLVIEVTKTGDFPGVVSSSAGWPWSLPPAAADLVLTCVVLRPSAIPLFHRLAGEASSLGSAGRGFTPCTMLPAADQALPAASARGRRPGGAARQARPCVLVAPAGASPAHGRKLRGSHDSAQGGSTASVRTSSKFPAQLDPCNETQLQKAGRVQHGWDRGAPRHACLAPLLVRPPAAPPPLCLPACLLATCNASASGTCLLAASRARLLCAYAAGLTMCILPQRLCCCWYLIVPLQWKPTTLLLSRP